MVEDARFEDGGEAPLALRALEPADLDVIAALVQDAILPATEMRYDRRKRRFALLLNRYRWELPPAKGTPERVQSLLVIEDVLKVATQGLNPREDGLVLSLLTVKWTQGEDGTGRIALTLAGDGAVAVDVEALEVTLKDVTKPYTAVSGKTPRHPE